MHEITVIGMFAIMVINMTTSYNKLEDYSLAMFEGVTLYSIVGTG